MYTEIVLSPVLAIGAAARQIKGAVRVAGGSACVPTIGGSGPDGYGYSEISAYGIPFRFTEIRSEDCLDEGVHRRSFDLFVNAQGRFATLSTFATNEVNGVSRAPSDPGLPGGGTWPTQEEPAKEA